MFLRENYEAHSDNSEFPMTLKAILTVEDEIKLNMENEIQLNEENHAGGLGLKMKRIWIT